MSKEERLIAVLVELKSVNLAHLNRGNWKLALTESTPRKIERRKYQLSLLTGHSSI